MRRLLVFSSEFPPGPGGIGTHAYQLAKHLIQSGWQVVVITPQDYASDEEIRAFNDSQPFSIVPLPSLSETKRAVKAISRWHIGSKWIKKWQPDLLLATGNKQVYLAAALTRYYRLPWVAVEHGHLPAGWERLLKRWSLQQATAVVCVSQYTQQQMWAMKVKPHAEQVIPNGADSTRFKVLPRQEVEQFRVSLGLNASHLLLTVGNVTARKGQEVVIRALPHILEKMPNTHYLMVGLPSKKNEFMNLAQELGVAEHTHFLGRVESDALVRFYNCCDLFVMTSRHTADEFEGYGIAVVEAALCEKPAVVSTSSGLTEAIIDGETGIGVPIDDEIRTDQAILSLLEDEPRRIRMGEAARQRALTEQTWPQRVKEYEVLFESLLTDSRDF